MCFGKNIIAKLGLALAMAVPAFAADVDPLYFATYDGQGNVTGRVEDALQQKYWNELMTFKIWGTNGISLGRVVASDSVGAVGTANGDLVYTFNRHSMGGPFYIGGDFKMGSGSGTDTIWTGPVRVRDFYVGQNPSKYYGDYCIEGKLRNYEGNEITAKTFTDMLPKDSATYNTNCGENGVKAVPKHLSIPLKPANPPSGSRVIDALTVDSRTLNLDFNNDVRMHDLYIKANDGQSILFKNEATLKIRVKSGSTLARLFLDGTMQITSATTIQVVYVDEDAKYKVDNTEPTGGRWYHEDGSAVIETPVPNKEYKGNVLFYCNGGIDWKAMNKGAIIQGTIMSPNDIKILSNLHFAGQFLAKTVTIGAEFEADDFRYVPFDPPELDPELFAHASIIEDNDNHALPIELNKAAKTERVTVTYCFDVAPKSNTVGDTASIEDFNIFDENNPETAKFPVFPICSKNQSGTINFSFGNTKPDKGNEVFVNAWVDDEKDEKTETLKFKVLKIDGAVLPESVKDGLFYVNVENALLFKYDNVEDKYKIAENSAPNELVAKIDIVGASASAKLTAGMTAKNDPSDQLNTLFEISVDASNTFALIKVKQQTMTMLDLDYESTVIKQLYEVTLTLEDDDGHAAQSVATTIEITDVNEAPIIDYIEDLSNPTAVGTFVLEPNENLKKGDPVGVIFAHDPDIKSSGRYDHIRYEIVDAANAPFELRGGDTIVVKTPEKLNFEKNPTFKFKVKAINEEWNTTTDKAVPNGSYLESVEEVDVMLKNVKEPPVIACKAGDTKCDGPYDVFENSEINKTTVHEFVVTDDDKDQYKTLTAVVKNSDGSDLDLFDAEIIPSATTDTSVLRVFVSGPIDYEKKIFEYEVWIIVTDVENMADTITRKINIIDVNEPPTITGVTDLNADYDETKNGAKENFTFYPKENTPKGDSVGFVHAKDPDSLHKSEFARLEYTVLDPKGNIPFAFKNPNDSLLVVTDASKLDFESGTIEFRFEVEVTNCEWELKNGSYVKTTRCLPPVTDSVFVKIQDVNEPPVITPDDTCEVGKCPTNCVGESCRDKKDDSDSCLVNCEDVNDHKDKKTTVGVKENSPDSTVIFSYTVSDVDAGQSAKLQASFDYITGEENKSGVKASELFTIGIETDASSGKQKVVLKVKNSLLLDYENLSDPVYNLVITVTDPKGKSATLLRAVQVLDVNEAPSIADAVIDLPENTPAGDTIKTLPVVDPDKDPKFRQLKYEIITQNGETVPFRMDSNNVVVTKTLNYEKNDKLVYEFKVAVTDITDPTLTDTANVVVNLKDVPENPIIIPDGCKEGENCTKDCVGDKCGDGKDDADTCLVNCDDVNLHKTTPVTVGVKENSPKGTLVFSYDVTDEDAGEVSKLKVSYNVLETTVKNGTKVSDLFEIKYDDVNHKIVATVKDESKLDYEALRLATSRNDPDPQYKLSIIVTDPKGLVDSIIRIIDILDENEAPGFVAEPCVIVEGNTAIGDSVGRIMHPIDVDSMSRNPDFYNNRFDYLDGDTTLFDMGTDDGWVIKLISKVILDCENGQYDCDTEGAYWVKLAYYDPRTPEIKHEGIVPISLVDVNEDPWIITEKVTLDENPKKGTFVDSIKGDDVDRYDTVLHYALVKDPSGCFDVSASGVVTVKESNCPYLNYEVNPVFPITVSITDNGDKGTGKNRITKEKEITVVLRDVNEPPHLDDKTIQIPESTSVGTRIDTLYATDPDNDPKFNKLTYTVIGGDTATFKVLPKTGVVVLKDSLDYELKKHTYKLVVRVDDGEFADTATLTIKIGNIEEQSKVVITRYDNVDSTWKYPDTVYTNKREGRITWKQDGEIAYVDTTLKKGKNVIVIKYKDPSKDYPGKDTLVVMFNDETPKVTVRHGAAEEFETNVFTIVEETAMGDADTNVYVNKTKDSIVVSVKDKASNINEKMTIVFDLEPVSVSQGTLDKVSSISAKTHPIDETKLSKASSISVNGSEYEYTYADVYGKDTVQVSYRTDKNGNPIKVPVINAKGKVDSMEIMTISYKTVIDDEEVTVSYIAEVNTGEVLAKGPSGEIMTQGASKKNSKKSSKDSTSSKNSNVSEGIFTVKSEITDSLGSTTVVSYTVDKKGTMVKNAEGDIGYSVSYTYVNMYGNAASKTLFIVLDQVMPVVKILSPEEGSVIRSNSVTVEWTVNGVKQDTLTLEGLEKGGNAIVRFYRDKAGNEASDTVFVIMKDSKDVDISVEQPVTEITKEKVAEYYAKNPPKDGQTFAVSIKNPTTEEEVETLIGGEFKAKKGSGKEPYPGVKGSKHLGPTLAMDVKLPVINGVGGLATLDDIISSDGMIALEGIDAKNAHKVSVQEYVEKYCEDDFKLTGDFSQINMYRTKMLVQIWIYTSLGNFVDYFTFEQDLNDPSYTNEAGLLNMYFEMKPDKDGFVKAENGKLYATGAYLYKVEATIRSELRCTLPSKTYSAEKEKKTGDGFSLTDKRKGDKLKSSDELLKPFGYKRPAN